MYLQWLALLARADGQHPGTTYPIAEIIVQDDGSTDNTVNILRQYAERVPQMQIHVNEKNLGFNRNFHTACLRATADYIAISDQDDVWMPNKLE